MSAETRTAAESLVAHNLPSEAQSENTRLFHALRHRKPLLEDTDAIQSVTVRLGLRQLIGQSPSFLAAKEQIAAVARYDVNILLLGETGTGKELFARAIHYLSVRSGQPFVPVNCGAIPVDLVENELFGHERGAFTGAGSATPGLVQEANGGTLFLDEIDALPSLAQVKLLRLLQEKEYRSLGSTQIRHADLRVIAAANASIRQAVADGKFRQDLYYRLNIVPVTLPRLSERLEDIPLLAHHFLKKYADEFHKNVTAFSGDALYTLMQYPWPGNVRELEHIVERAVVLAQEVIIDVPDLRLTDSVAPHAPSSFQEAKESALAHFERTYLHALLTSSQGNISQAARIARKDRRALRQLLKKHQIDAASFKSRHLSR